MLLHGEEINGGITGFPEFPHILNICKRDPVTHKLNKDSHHKLYDWSMPEFMQVCFWRITEKIDGMNLRFCIDNKIGSVYTAGRTEKAQFNNSQIAYFQSINSLALLEASLNMFSKTSKVVLFGELYVPGTSKSSLKKGFMVLIHYMF